MAGPLPYFKHWQKEYLASARLRRLSIAGHGLLFILQNYQWEEGSLPSDPAEVFKIIGGDRKMFDAAWKEVSSLFHVDGDEMKYPPLDVQRQETLGKVDRLTANAVKGGAPRGTTKLKPGDNPKVLNSKTKTEPSDKLNQNHNHIENPSIPSEGDGGQDAPPAEKRPVFTEEAFQAWFAEFRAAFPQRKGNYGWPKAESKLRTLIGQGLKPKTVLDGLARFAAHVRADDKWGSPFVPMASTWVNAKGWADEYPVVLKVEAGGKSVPLEDQDAALEAEMRRMGR